MFGSLSMQHYTAVEQTLLAKRSSINTYMLIPMDTFEINSKNIYNIGICSGGRRDINRPMQRKVSLTNKRESWREVKSPKALPINKRICDRRDFWREIKSPKLLNVIRYG
jgi:hypothetical protein